MANRWNRRMNMAKTWLMEHAYLVTFGVVIVIVAASALYTREIRAEQEAEIAAAAKAPEIGQESLKTVQPTVSPLPSIAPLQVRYDAIERMSRSTVWPLQGSVIRGYDEQEVVYWKVLGSYRVHTGIDIAGEEGESVLCAADGTIETVMRDELWGWRIGVRQTDGRHAVYAGLSEATVDEGENVVRGKEIGFLLGRIPCEGEMQAHLHMELYRDGKVQDPEGMMPER